MLRPTGNLVVRNMVEKQLGKHLYTTQEIAALNMNDIEESYDPEYGKGKWVYGIAVFPELPKETRQFEIRITGLGKRILPLFLPGRMFYPETMVEMASALQPTMRRSLRFFYRKLGQGPEARMTPIVAEQRRSEWLWIWPLQIQVGRFREANIERASGLKRKYVYAPYYIHNNTHLPQKIDIIEAGFAEDILWGGEKLQVVIAENGENDARWKAQTLNEVKKRIASGEEKEFALQNEAYPLTYTDVDMDKYYRENFKLKSGEAFEYIPTDPQVQEDRQALIDRLKSNNNTEKMITELKKKKETDIARKAQFLPEGERDRLFKGTIEPGKLVSGLFIVHWGVNDLDELITRLIQKLQAQAITGAPVENKLLLQEYLKLCKKNPHPDVEWARPAEPSRHIIEQMLIDQATAQLKEKDIEISEEDVQRYGTKAPIGVLINQLAWERLNNRTQDKAITDAYFKVITTGAPESAVIASSYQKFLPNEREALPEIPDEFKAEGTREGIGQGSLGTTQKTTGDKKEKSEETFDDVW